MKKLFATVTAFLISASLCINSFAAFTGYGDITGDFKVNSADALQVLMFAVGNTDFDADQKIAADVDGDKKINSADALMILNYSVGNIDAFTVEIGTDPDIGHDVF